MMFFLMLLFLLYLSFTMHQFPKVETEEDTIFVLPKGPLLVMGLVGFCVMMGPGDITIRDST